MDSGYHGNAMVKAGQSCGIGIKDGRVLITPCILYPTESGDVSILGTGGGVARSTVKKIERLGHHMWSMIGGWGMMEKLEHAGCKGRPCCCMVWMT